MFSFCVLNRMKGKLLEIFRKIGRDIGEGSVLFIGFLFEESIKIIVRKKISLFF